MAILRKDYLFPYLKEALQGKSIELIEDEVLLPREITEDWLILVDEAEKLCLTRLHNPSQGIFTICIPPGGSAEERFNLVYGQIRMWIRAALDAGKSIKVALDAGNGGNLTCLDQAVEGLEGLHKDYGENPNVGVMVLNDRLCEGLMAAVAKRKAVLA